MSNESEKAKKELMTPPKPTTSIKAPSKMGSTAVKMPKAKKPASPFGKPSLFFKSEDFKGVKHPNIENLRSFLEKTRSKKSSASNL